MARTSHVCLCPRCNRSGDRGFWWKRLLLMGFMAGCVLTFFQSLYVMGKGESQSRSSVVVPNHRVEEVQMKSDYRVVYDPPILERDNVRCEHGKPLSACTKCSR